MSAERPRWLKPALIVLAVLLLVTQLAGYALHRAAERVLGPDGQIDSLHMSLTGAVVVRGLKLGVPQGWPAGDTLTVDRAVIRPEWWSILGGGNHFRIHSVRIEGAYLALRRSRDQGIEVTPTLFKQELQERAEQEWDGAVIIEHAEVENSTLEFFDDTVPHPPLKLRVEQLGASIDDLLIPALNTRTQLDLHGMVKGAAGDGDLAIKGWMELDNRESALDIALHGLDLTAVQPYVIRDSDMGVQRGLMDLQLHSQVSGSKLDAPGEVTLSQLEFDQHGGLKNTFMGASRSALIRLMEEQHGQLHLKFRLDGDLDNPSFALNEALPLRLAVGMAETLGVSIKGVVGGVGTLGGKGLEAIGGAAKGIGGAIGHLFGGHSGSDPGADPKNNPDPPQPSK